MTYLLTHIICTDEIEVICMNYIHNYTFIQEPITNLLFFIYGKRLGFVECDKSCARLIYLPTVVFISRTCLK